MKYIRLHIHTASLLACGIALASCSPPVPAERPSAQTTARLEEKAAPSSETRVFFGETHLHTANSSDAVLMGTRLMPEDALRFGSGETVVSNTGIKAKLARPLDFMVVADHAEQIGTGREILTGNPLLTADPTVKRWAEMMKGTPEQSRSAARELISGFSQGKLPPILYDRVITAKLVESVWAQHVATVERYNQPGKFTAFIGYEFTSLVKGNNLHRIVVFRDGVEKFGKTMPFTALDSKDPEDLWKWFANYEQTTGGQVLGIPHNGNLSNGMMFALNDFKGGPLTADYARRRQYWEPLTEIVQAKGESESHPFLSPNDEFANFGKAGWDVGNLDLSATKTNDMFASEYAREALKRGLMLEAKLGINPFKFGMIGAGDIHTGLSTSEENNHLGETFILEPSAERAMRTEKRGSITRFGWQSLAAGLAAVWAKENTREAIFDAMRRREVYATTGTRLQVRLFGGWDFSERDLKGNWVKQGYARGVPMGGDLRPATSKAPSFIISALKDATGANLDRIQIIKGWVDASGQTHERIFNVAWSSPETRKVSKDGRLTAVGDTVDLKTATYSNSIGAVELRTVWRDPEFKPGVRAFYYARVLEIPTPRWPAYDAARYQFALPDGVKAESQERAYTSPIWYSPKVAP
ncbi:DUF3604 domain-containing protein [Sphingorhabdus sp.]|jgi:hypothetical protein|nr:DUF3604 domain-containing protein [Sphingomonadales bacterium]MBK9432209.1 DUF3604 domain-containing protein [Sphingomonadales bacterium]